MYSITEDDKPKDRSRQRPNSGSMSATITAASTTQTFKKGQNNISTRKEEVGVPEKQGKEGQLGWG